MSKPPEEKQIFKALELEVKQWINAEGNVIEPIKLSNFTGKFKIIYCFQSWCQK